MTTPRVLEAYGADDGSIVEADAFDLLAELPDGVLDMILCDLPYGTTRDAWDHVLDPARMWPEFLRVTKPNAAIVLFAQAPFDKVLGASRIDLLRYEWIWRKERGTGHLNSKIAPQKDHENVLVFYRSPPTYNPQMREGKPYRVRKGSNGRNYGGDSKPEIVTENDGERYPLTVLDFPRDRPRLHPTQKPIDLCRYLVRTYTNAGEIVGDFTCGSGTTPLAARLEGRRFIAGDNDPESVALTVSRLLQAEPVGLTRAA